jgi:hypothetical protein
MSTQRIHQHATLADHPRCLRSLTVPSGEADLIEERGVVVEEILLDDPAVPPLRCRGVEDVERRGEGPVASPRRVKSVPGTSQLIVVQSAGRDGGKPCLGLGSGNDGNLLIASSQRLHRRQITRASAPQKDHRLYRRHTEIAQPGPQRLDVARNLPAAGNDTGSSGATTQLSAVHFVFTPSTPPVPSSTWSMSRPCNDT